jgi:hypothetical protein
VQKHAQPGTKEDLGKRSVLPSADSLKERPALSKKNDPLELCYWPQYSWLRPKNGKGISCLWDLHLAKKIREYAGPDQAEKTYKYEISYKLIFKMQKET